MEKTEIDRIINEALLPLKGIPLPDTGKELAKLKRRQRRRISVYAGIPVAAAAIAGLFLVAPSLFGPGHISEPVAQITPSTYIVDPRGNITFINDTSKRIEYAERDGAKSIRYTQDSISPTVRTYMLTVPKGDDFRLTLSDGTTVWINSGSSITYTSGFSAEEERVVTLSYGEAFFDVAHDSSRPFIVRTGLSDTKALGTRFNVRAYGRESCDITLIDGSVAVKHALAEWDDGLILEPGFNASVTQHDITVSEVDLWKHVSWIDGYYFYDRESVVGILRSICERYDYRISHIKAAGDYGRSDIHFWFYRSEDIEVVLRRLGEVAGADIEIAGKNIILNGIK